MDRLPHAVERVGAGGSAPKTGEGGALYLHHWFAKMWASRQPGCGWHCLGMLGHSCSHQLPVSPWALYLLVGQRMGEGPVSRVHHLLLHFFRTVMAYLGDARLGCTYIAGMLHDHLNHTQAEPMSHQRLRRTFVNTKCMYRLCFLTVFYYSFPEKFYELKK